MAPSKPKRINPKSKTQVVSVAPFNSEGMLLFGLRNDDGRWNTPGGHLEEGETPEEGALRELKEETGLTGSNLEFLGQADLGRVVVYSFSCEVSDTTPSGSEDPDEECETWQFVELDDIPDKITSNLHNKPDVTLTLLGLQEGKLQKSNIEAGNHSIFVQHLSNVPHLTTLDPEFQGTGSAGAEANRSQRIPRVYLYTRPGQPEGDVTGQYLYFGELPVGSKLYDLHEDRLQFMQPKWRQTDSGQIYEEPDLDVIEKRICDLGYAGYSAGDNRIAYFYPLEVKQAIRQDLRKAEDETSVAEQLKTKIKHAKTPNLPSTKLKAPVGPNLVITHNLSEPNLHHAHELGGLAAPSLAISHKDAPLTGFGEISLVAGHDLVDPQKGVPVFGADIYSPRHPRANYKVNAKPLSQFKTWIEPHTKATGGYTGDIESEISEGGVDRALGTHKISRPLGLAYLHEKGTPPQISMKPIKGDSDWIHEPAMEGFFAQNGHKAYEEYGGDYHQKLSQAAKEAIETWKPGEFDDAETIQDIRNTHHDWVYGEPDESGLRPHLLAFSKVPKIVKEHQNKGKQEVDSHKLNAEIEAKTLNNPEFEAWAKQKLAPLQGEAYLPKRTQMGNVRKMPYNMDTVLKEMTRKIRQGENFNYGLGTARAGGAKKFKNLEQIKANQANIVPKDEFTTHKDKMNDKFGELAEKLSGYHHRGGMRSLDGLAEAIGESYKKGKSVWNELKQSGFNNVPSHILTEVAQFAQDLIKMPTEYFEAKPQRAVGIHEFHGAVVPHDISPETEKILSHHGLDIVKYPRGDEAARAEAIRNVAGGKKLMLSEDSWAEGLEKAEQLNKGIVSAGLLAAHLMGGAISPPHRDSPTIQQMETQTAKWTPNNLHPEMHGIAQLESSYGQNVKHSQSKSGDWDTAFGALGMKAKTAHEEYKASKFLNKTYPGLQNPEDFLREFKANPKLYNLTAASHFTRLKARHGSTARAAYAWRFGTGACAKASDEEVAKSPYVQSYTHMMLRRAEGKPMVEPPKPSSPVKTSATPKPLKKAIDPKDFAPHLKASDDKGRQLVNHTPDLEAHPPEIDNEVKHYRENVLNSPKGFKREKGKKEGTTKKTIYKAKANPEVGITEDMGVMIKPYHEKIPKRIAGWQRFPIQGWAEMTNQALYHAGGIGHLHQKVHVSEHPMENPKTGEKRQEPALAIHLAKGFKPAVSAYDEAPIPPTPGVEFKTPQTQREDYKAKNPDDIRKIALMDFVSNNLDRHQGNLMLNKDGDVLAVDHSRSFQYTNVPKSKTGKTPREIDRLSKAGTYMEDKLWDYVKEGATSKYEPLLPKNQYNPRLSYDQHMAMMEAYTPVIEDWWAKNRDGIVKAMESRLPQIKDSEIQKHIRRNFMARVNMLDDMAQNGVANFGHDALASTSVPWYPWHQMTDEEKEEKARNP